MKTPNKKTIFKVILYIVLGIYFLVSSYFIGTMLYEKIYIKSLENEFTKGRSQGFQEVYNFIEQSKCDFVQLENKTEEGIKTVRVLNIECLPKSNE